MINKNIPSERKRTSKSCKNLIRVLEYLYFLVVLLHDLVKDTHESFLSTVSVNETCYSESGTKRRYGTDFIQRCK